MERNCGLVEVGHGQTLLLGFFLRYSSFFSTALASLSKVCASKYLLIPVLRRSHDSCRGQGIRSEHLASPTAQRVKSGSPSMARTIFNRQISFGRRAKQIGRASCRE